jgi:hypothetical protein
MANQLGNSPTVELVKKPNVVRDMDMAEAGEACGMTGYR